MEQEKVPDPSNDKAMGELHDFVSAWTERHKLQGPKELYYLGLYLTGRLNVQVKLENLRLMYAEGEEKPDYAARCDELIANYEAMYCKCSYAELLENAIAFHPGSDSVTANNGTCATCGKPVRQDG